MSKFRSWNNRQNALRMFGDLQPEATMETINRLAQQWHVDPKTIHCVDRGNTKVYYSDVDPHLVWWDSTRLNPV